MDENIRNFVDTLRIAIATPATKELQILAKNATICGNMNVVNNFVRTSLTLTPPGKFLNLTGREILCTTDDQVVSFTYNNTPEYRDKKGDDLVDDEYYHLEVLSAVQADFIRGGRTWDGYRQETEKEDAHMYDDDVVKFNTQRASFDPLYIEKMNDNLDFFKKLFEMFPYSTEEKSENSNGRVSLVNTPLRYGINSAREITVGAVYKHCTESNDEIVVNRGQATVDIRSPTLTGRGLFCIGADHRKTPFLMLEVQPGEKHDGSTDPTYTHCSRVYIATPF